MHKPVLLQPIIELLDIQAGEVVADATLGLAGHAVAMAKQLGPSGTLIGFDADADLLAKAKENLKDVDCQKIFINTNFRHIKSELDKEGIERINKALFDLGLNSEQFENSGRGFSFQKNEPLLMTLSADIKKETLTAREIVNTWTEESLADIIYGYGEEQFSRRIAKAVVEARKIKQLETTFDLVKTIKSVVPVFYTKKRIHFATKTFQALRIAVNDELGNLAAALRQLTGVLKKGGRGLVISFHSLEDRMVKQTYRELEKEGIIRVITKKPVRPSAAEIESNPRSRSAKLRVLEIS